MEVREAIKRIEDHKEIHFANEPMAIKITEALDMAIEALEMREELNRPINDIYSAAIALCMRLECKNCPVTLFDYDKRTEFEKCCLHEPCQINLYNWIIDQSKQ